MDLGRPDQNMTYEIFIELIKVLFNGKGEECYLKAKRQSWRGDYNKVYIIHALYAMMRPSAFCFFFI